jgi:hypothetical protein
MAIDLNDPIVNTGLLAGSGALLGGSILTENFLNNNVAALKDWDKQTQALWRNPAFKSEVTGRWLQTSPEVADKLLDTYVRNAHKLSSQGVGPFRVGTTIGTIRTLPNTIKSLFGKGVDMAGTKEHYRMFSDTNADLGKLKAHMLDVAKESELLHPSRVKEMRAAFSKLSPEAKKIIADSDTIVSKYEKLKNLKDDKVGIKYLEDFVLGHGDLHPGAAKLVGGGVIGTIDPVTGKISNEVVHTGFGKNYIKATDRPLRVLRAGNKLSIGARAAGAALGLYGLGRIIGNKMFSKEASTISEKEIPVDGDNMLAMTELMLGGGLTTLSGSTLADKIKQLIADRKKAPNLNVGFNYGAWPFIGDGHKAPAENLRTILERYIAALPEGHELKGVTLRDATGAPIMNEFGFPERKGGVQFKDLSLRPGGVTPAHAENFNIIYDTGLGAAVPSKFVDPNIADNRAYGIDTAGKLKGEAQTIKRYVTDTPSLYDNPLNIKIPSFGPAASGLNLPFNVRIPGISTLPPAIGHGYWGANNDILGYGKIPDSIKNTLKVPFISGEFKNLAPTVAGTPFINPELLDAMNTYATKEQKLGRIRELANLLPEGSADRESISKVLDDITSGKKVVTVAGSGRGDWVANRTFHFLDSADRLNLKDVTVVPLMGGYTGAKNLPKEQGKLLVDSIRNADPKGRIVSFGRLNNELYNLMQQVSDVNMASTGMMAVSEAANAGNVQAIPESWFDAEGSDSSKSLKKFQTKGWKDVLKANGVDISAADYDAIFKNSTPFLNNWNKGSMERLPEDFGDVFKRMRTYEGPLREGVAKYFNNWGVSGDTIKHNVQKIDTDEVAKWLLDDKKIKSLSETAYEAAKANRAKIPAAYNELATDMVKTLQNNVRRQKWKAMPGVLGGALGAGVGLYGMVDGFNKLLSPETFAPNISI